MKVYKSHSLETARWLGSIACLYSGATCEPDFDLVTVSPDCSKDTTTGIFMKATTIMTTISHYRSQKRDHDSSGVQTKGLSSPDEIATVSPCAPEPAQRVQSFGSLNNCLTMSNFAPRGMK